ncbi:hypothetical protein Pelo_9607 [Pelomyxa schiedti]|nr:hypothetical protein Pelo_9607 [Pelomyxa schiedti]
MFGKFVIWNHPKLQKLTTLFDCSLFTREMVVSCLTGRSFRPLSSRSVKWAITQFRLEASHIKMNHNSLLYSLLLENKTNCVAWLIDSFGITLAEVIDMFVTVPPLRGYRFKINLQIWKMIVRKFPRIDTEVVRQHFLAIAAHSPAIASFTMNKFGITLDEIRHQFDDYEREIEMEEEYRPYLTDELRMWLGISD